LCRVLVEAGAAFDARDSVGNTPLHEAVSLLVEDAAAFAGTNAAAELVDLGADSTIVDAFGRTPLDVVLHAIRELDDDERWDDVEADDVLHWESGVLHLTAYTA